MPKAKNKTAGIFAAAVIAAALAIWLLPASLAQGQAAQAKESFKDYWTRFKAALAKNDRKAIASMTKHCKCGQMPFDNDEKFLNEWYSKLRRNVACLSRAKPIAGTERGKPSYSVICRTDEDELVFERIAGEWKLVNVNPAP